MLSPRFAATFSDILYHFLKGTRQCRVPTFRNWYYYVEKKLKQLTTEDTKELFFIY